MKNIIKYTLFTLFFFFIIKSQLERFIIKTHGKETIGIVQDIYKVGSKGSIQFNYLYYVGDKAYNGDDYLSYINELKIGDTIPIIYYHQFYFLSAYKKNIEHRFQF